MFCVAALVVFSILGIFSATHRRLALEALDCVFRRVTFRPCISGFKEKIQAKILGKVMSRSLRLARFINKYFELLSWIFLILMLWSTIWVIRGGYNYYLYGNCNGLNAGGFCLYDLHGENNKISPVTAGCSVKPPSESNLTLEGVDLNIFQSRNPAGKDEIFFIGCCSCEYTRKTLPIIEKILNDNDIHFIFAHFPVKEETRYLSLYDYCAYKIDPEKFWNLNDRFFSAKEEDLANREFAMSQAAAAGFDQKTMEACIADPNTEKAVAIQTEAITKTNLYGTPTIFINKKPVVGPKPERVYERMLGKSIWGW